MRGLFLGDVVGKPGREAVSDYLAGKKDKYDIIIANGENAAGGRGITEKTASALFYAGVDILTMGNHVWDKQEAKSLLAKETRIVRPANYPQGLPGQGLRFFPSRTGKELAVINLSGRTFLNNLDCPFLLAKELIKRALARTPYLIIDFHAEATSEKLAFRYYIQDQASLLVGTHTHVQTNDDVITDGQMGYITDLGMCGPLDSVLGTRKEQCIERFLTALPVRLQVAPGPKQISGVAFELDQKGRCIFLEKIREEIV